MDKTERIIRITESVSNFPWSSTVKDRLFKRMRRKTKQNAQEWIFHDQRIQDLLRIAEIYQKGASA